MLRTISPIDDSVYVERPLATAAHIDRVLIGARKAQRAWRNVSIAERAHMLRLFCDAFETAPR